MQVFLETERLVLRRFTEADVDNLVDPRQRPGRHALHQRRTTNPSRGDPERLPAGLPRLLSAVRGLWLLGAIEKSTGEFLGWFHFRPPQGASLDDVELGYRLRKSAWGKGYATEGSRALIRKGFIELGVQRVFAGTMAVNVASRRVMEKAGLRLVRTFHQPWPDHIDGAEHGDVEYALRKAEWE
jgi:RimJ/RimL family protein N-acetyltransferase